MVKKISSKQLDKIKSDKKSSVIPTQTQAATTKRKASPKPAPAADSQAVKAVTKATEDTARTVQNLANMQQVSNNNIEKLVSQLTAKLDNGPVEYRLKFVRKPNELLDYIDITLKNKTHTLN